MASIQKRGTSYRIRVSNGRRPDGTQILETATYTPDPGMTKNQIEKALEAFVVDFEREVKSGKNIKGERMPFKQLAEQFLADTSPEDPNIIEPLEKTTWYNYKATIEHRIIPRLGNIPIGQVIPKTIKDYQKALRKDGVRLDGKPGALSDGTIRKDCGIISSILSYAVGEGYLPINPLIYAGRQNHRKQNKKEYEVNYLTIEQVKHLLWAMDHPIETKRKAHDRVDDTGKPYHVQEYSSVWQLSLQWRAYFYLALFVGDRRGENVSFTWEDINLKTGEVDINTSTAYVNREIIHKSTKTGRSRVPVIPQVVINILKQWKVEQKKICMELGSQWVGYRGSEFDKNYVFIQWNGKQMHPDSPYGKFKQLIKVYNENAAKNANEMIPPQTRPHDLRHTAASILISNNMDPRSVAGVLGHADPTTTLNIYSYFFRTKNQEAATIMSDVLFG